MRRLLAMLWVCAVLAAGAAAAAPGVLWPLDFACGKVGWRYEHADIVWPGLYWRGADHPPCATALDQPATWGVLRLGGRFDPPPAPVYDAADVVAPLTGELPLIDGVIGVAEWHGALPVVTRLEGGQELLLLLQRTEQTLYVCVAMPSVPMARAGQTVELAVNRGGTEGGVLCPSHLLLRATLDNPQHTSLAAFTGGNGRWVPEPLGREEPLLRAAGGSGGDAAWSYPVFEFALPLSRLRPPDTCPEAVGFALRLQTLSRGRELAPPLPEREAVYWPDGRTTYGAKPAPPLSERPDFWGRLRLSESDPAGGLEVPLAPAPIHLDGQLGLKEWQSAPPARYDLPGDQWRVLRALRDDQNVYFGVRLRAARGLRRGEGCALLIDCAGDGGLRPRSDDLQLRLPLSPDSCVELLHYQNGAWVGGAAAEIKGAAYPFSDYESCYELAVPLTLLGGLPAPAVFATPPARPAVAVEVSYSVGPDR